MPELNEAPFIDVIFILICFFKKKSKTRVEPFFVDRIRKLSVSMESLFEMPRRKN